MTDKVVFPIEAYRQGMDDERERILAMLENPDETLLMGGVLPDSRRTAEQFRAIRLGVDLAIALIKGENK